MTPNIREVRVNPEMQFTTDDLCRMLFGKGVHAFAEEVRNDTTGKYDFLREDGDEKNDPHNSNEIRVQIRALHAVRKMVERVHAVYRPVCVPEVQM